MHPNADLTYRTLTVQGGIDTIIETMPKTSSSSTGLSREDVVDKLCEELLAKVPQQFEAEASKDKLRKLPGGPTAPLTVHLRQEMDRLNIIIDLTTRTLKNLRLAIAGTVALAGDLIQALDSLFDARIPAVWLKKSWEAATLGAWFSGLIARFAQLDKWVNTGRPRAFWLTGFFNPQGFLTGAFRVRGCCVLACLPKLWQRTDAPSRCRAHPHPVCFRSDEAGGEPAPRG
jgi:dynein heavy chain